MTSPFHTDEDEKTNQLSSEAWYAEEPVQMIKTHHEQQTIIPPHLQPSFFPITFNAPDSSGPSLLDCLSLDKCFFLHYMNCVVSENILLLPPLQTHICSITNEHCNVIGHATHCLFCCR